MTTELTFRQYLDLMRRRSWLLAACFVGALIAAFVWSASQTPLYRSTTQILINQRAANEVLDGSGGTSISVADRLATNEVVLFNSQLVRTEAIEVLGFPAVARARSETRSDVIIVTATNRDPFRAQLVAQTYAEAYLDVRRQQFVQERIDTSEILFEQISELDQEILALGESADTTRQQSLRDDLLQSYDRLRITADLGNTGSARIVNDAQLPLAPFTPNTQRNLLLGGVLGLMFGAMAAVLLESLDRSIESREAIEALTPGITALALIPRLESNHEVVALANPDGLESEVFRTLRANIEFASVDKKLQVIQVSSPGPAAGKTTVAANLAVVMAQAGQRVAVIDADLRRPRLHAAFGLEQVPGLSSLIVGRESANDSSHALSLNNGQLVVFPSGPTPPGPSELLGSDRAKHTFSRLRRSLDVIIVDCPPVLPVADALVLARHVDATIVVANARFTKADDLQRALDQLDHAGANVVGTVLNEVKAKKGGSPYGYGYGYGYGTPETTTSLWQRWRSRNAPIAHRRADTAAMPSSELPRFRATPHYETDDGLGGGYLSSEPGTVATSSQRKAAANATSNPTTGNADKDKTPTDRTSGSTESPKTAASNGAANSDDHTTESASASDNSEDAWGDKQAFRTLSSTVAELRDHDEMSETDD